jgi:hypothetical protein
MKRLWSIQSLLWLALVLALVGSLRHVAWGFSTLERGDLIAGYVQAVAVDVGLFALAIGIQDRRRQARPTLALWVGVGLFSLVSTYANLLHGLYFATDIGLSSWAWLVGARPVILSGVLPALVIYLSEVAGDDRNYTAKIAEREAKRAGRPVSSETATATPEMSSTVALDAQPDTLAQARTVKGEQDAQAKAERVDKLLALCQANPDVGVTELAAAIGVSRTAVYKYVDELTAAGRLHKNGNGWEVKA